MNKHLGQRGLTLVEVVIAMAIMAFVMLAVSSGLLTLSKQSKTVDDKAFAVQKAIQMLEELRGHVAYANASVGILDGYDDGIGFSDVLTTRSEAAGPGDPLSGNRAGRYKRRITVLKLPNEPLARRVYVRVYRAENDALLAETVSILRTVANEYVPTQVFDLYIVALENVPGWWVALSSLKPMFDGILQDLQTRLPGVEIRTHWVTRLGYGRDPHYTPYINETARTEDAAMPYVYFYPGLTSLSGDDFFYYVPNSIGGQINVDGAVRNAGVYALADQYNHAVRQPDEESRYAAAAAAAESAGLPAPEISLRMLVDRLHESAAPLENALIVNLHGELMPLPPMRNYSDAAKDPAGRPGQRVVAHPENLEVAAGGGVDLRVYSYVTDPDVRAGTEAVPTVSLYLPNDNVADGSISVRKLVGNSTSAYEWISAAAGGDYAVYHPNGFDTLILLSSSPLVSPTNSLAPGGGPSGGLTPGLVYEFYDGDWNALPDFDAENAELIGTVANFDISPADISDYFGMRFTGYIQIDTAGTYTFYTESDDGSKLYINGAQIVDNDGLHGMVEASGSTALTVGTHTIRVDFFEKTGGADLNVRYAGPGISKQTIPDDKLQRLDDYIPGLAFGYYEGDWTALPDFDALSAVESGGNRGFSFYPRNQTNYFGFRWQGNVYIPADGNYTFYTTSNDGSRLWINGGLVVDNDGTHSSQERSGSLALTVGTHTITVGYFDRTGSDNLSVAWEGPSLAKQALTEANLSFDPAAAGARGLSTAGRLYALEYVPAPLAATSFLEGVRDLTAAGAEPKNTARWRVRFAPGALSSARHAVETRLGADLTAGTAGNQPSNVSRTWVWVGVSAPETERYQFIGDPRHVPYVDVVAGERYNWYFRDVDDADWPGFAKAGNGWNSSGNRPNYDVPRLFQVFREGLVASEALFNSITGFSFYYTGLGGEMGYDGSNGFPSGLRIRNTPWSPSQNIVRGVNEITSDFDIHHMRLISNAADTWWGLHWLGELYPDSAYAAWAADGNLATGAGNYYRATYGAKGFATDYQKRTNRQGSASFFNGNSGSGMFNHEYQDSNTAAITSTGTEVAQDFNFPLLSSMNASRPFRLNHGSGQPPEWNETAYSALRTSLSTLETFYEAGDTSYDSSALIRMDRGANTAGIVMNGLSPQTNFGSAQIGKLCVVNLMRAFMSSGHPGLSNRVPQLPLVSISSPVVSAEIVDPTTLEVSWTTQWTRWDGETYTDAYAASFVESTAVTYNVKYSQDNGKNWKFVQDDADAEAGVVDAGKALATPYDWNVSALPRGSYLVRVEAFLDGRDLHYAYNQRQLYIQR